MKTRALLILAILLCRLLPAFGEGKLSDAAIKAKLLGYWGNARHAYLIKNDGVMYMCPRDISTTTNRWEVKDGKFYLDTEPHEIVALTDAKFVYRSLGSKAFTVRWKRLTEKEAEWK
jgi:hypothetical protein